jgi:peptidase E
VRKVLLTSAGFENPNIAKSFLELCGKEPGAIKAMFIPTAAISPEAIAVLPKCMNDLLSIGVLPGNISVFDLHRKLARKELMRYDALYVCGGDPGYLLSRINDSGSRGAILDFIDRGKVYVGVSAGSIICAIGLPRNLGILNARIAVHAKLGGPRGPINPSPADAISLTNRQAIYVADEGAEIID